METRPYFIFGDLLACTMIGAACGLACMALIGEGWNMVIAMFAGMAIGMILATIVSVICFLALFGAMEVMIPAMLTGMMSGMVISMIVTMQPLASGWCAMLGALIGITCLIATYIANLLLSGKKSYE